MPYVTPTHAAQLRNHYRLTQAEFAWALQVHPMTVSKWERGIKAIPARCQPWLELLARAKRDMGMTIIEGRYGLAEIAQQGADDASMLAPPGWVITGWWQRVMRFDRPD